jgi:hypothetical protein
MSHQGLGFLNAAAAATGKLTCATRSRSGSDLWIIIAGEAWQAATHSNPQENKNMKVNYGRAKRNPSAGKHRG